MPTPGARNRLTVFPTELGWMAVFGTGRVLRRLTLGHASALAARKAIEKAEGRSLALGNGNPMLVGRLQAYAAGRCEDFRDIPIDLGPVRAFQQAVLRHCRKIPHGKTCTYGELAARAGYPGAARAVGNCMASNPLPLVIPCHRVVLSNGGVGGYSGRGASRLKRRLLDLEAGNNPLYGLIVATHS